MDFLYHGQTRVPQSQLMAFIKTARSLGVRGLNENGEKEVAEIFEKAPEDPEKDEIVKTEGDFSYQAETDNKNFNQPNILENEELPQNIDQKEEDHEIIKNNKRPNISRNQEDTEAAPKHRSSYWR